MYVVLPAKGECVQLRFLSALPLLASTVHLIVPAEGGVYANRDKAHLSILKSTRPVKLTQNRIKTGPDAHMRIYTQAQGHASCVSLN